MASLGVTGLPVAEGGNVHLNVPPVPGQVAPAVPAWANNGGAPVLIIVNKYLQERASLVFGLASWIGETCLPPSPKGPPKILGPPLPARSRSPRARQAPGASPLIVSSDSGFPLKPSRVCCLLLTLPQSAPGASRCRRSTCPRWCRHHRRSGPRHRPRMALERGLRCRGRATIDNLEFSGKASNRQANIDILQL